MGEAARESVRQQFLLPRLALDYVNVAQAGMETASNGKFHDADPSKAEHPDFQQGSGLIGRSLVVDR